jgi:hypothetical protein
MTKFSGGKDLGFISISGRLCLWVGDILKHANQGAEQEPAITQDAQVKPLQKASMQFGQVN